MDLFVNIAINQITVETEYNKTHCFELHFSAVSCRIHKCMLKLYCKEDICEQCILQKYHSLLRA